MVSHKWENIDDFINYREENEIKYLTELTSILPPPMDTNPILETNRAEQHIFKKTWTDT